MDLAGAGTEGPDFLGGLGEVRPGGLGADFGGTGDFITGTSGLGSILIRGLSSFLGGI